MNQTINRFFYAWIFLTIFPTPKSLPTAKEEDWGRIAPYFVLVGYVLGIFVFSFSFFFKFLNAPPLFSAALVVLLWELFTGALHLDGVMDTFDGIGCREKDRKHEAIKDSRVGAIGAIAGIFIIVIKIICLYELFKGDILILPLFIIPLARLCVVYALSFSKSNSEKGTSSNLIKSGINKPKDFYINLSSFFGIALLVLLFSGKYSVIGISFFLGICFLVNLFWAHWLSKEFDGLNGDTYGALIELTEVTVLILSVIFRTYF